MLNRRNSTRTFAEKIYQLRRQNGWSQEDIAQRLHVSRQSISKWENALSMPEGTKLSEIARLFQISLDDLLSEDPIASPFASAYCSLQRDIAHLQEAEDFLKAVRKIAHSCGISFLSCMLSPFLLLYLVAQHQFVPDSGISEQMAAGLGSLSTSLIMLSAMSAPLIHILCFPYRSWLRRDILVAADVRQALMEDRQRRLRPFILRIVLAILLLLLTIPSFVMICIQYGERIETIYGGMLLLGGLGIALGILISCGIQIIAYQRLLSDHVHLTPYGTLR